MSGNIMIDGCQNCHQSKMHHMPDGSCLFEPTQYKAFPSVVVYPQSHWDVDPAHVEQPKKSWLRRLFT